MNDLRDLLSKLTSVETDSNASICESCGCDMNMPPAPEPMIALSDILKLAGMAPDMSQMTQPMEADEAHPDGKCECPHCGNVHTPGATNEDEMEEGKQDRIQKARDLLDRACGLDACSPEELGDHRIDMIAQETGLKRGHVKSIANHMDDEDAMEEGNAFTGAKAEAEAEGKAEFEVSGEKYKVEADEGMGSAFMQAYRALSQGK